MTTAEGPRPYEPKRRPFDTLEELLLVKDVDAQLFFGPPAAAEAAARGGQAATSEWLSRSPVRTTPTEKATPARTSTRRARVSS